MITKGKEYQTLDGKSVIIHSTDMGGDHPVHGAIETKAGWIPHSWTQDGESPMISDFDIIEKWEPKKGEWCWFRNQPGSNTATLSRFDKMTTGGNFMDTAGDVYMACEQFESDLPFGFGHE